MSGRTTRFQGEYAGCVIEGLMKALVQSPDTIQRILNEHGLQAIEPDKWYDLELTRAIFYDIQRLIGPRALYNVGVHVYLAAPVPPEIKDPASALASLDAVYRMNARGPDIGGVTTRMDGVRSARLKFTQPIPCQLDQGICAGCCKRFGAVALVEHGPGGCRDDGNPFCEMHVSW